MSTVNSLNSDHGYMAVEHTSSDYVSSACNVNNTDRLMSEPTKATDDIGAISTGNVTHENGAATTQDENIIKSLSVSNGSLKHNDELGENMEQTTCSNIEPESLVKGCDSESSPVRADRSQSIVTAVANSSVKNKRLPRKQLFVLTNFVVLTYIMVTLSN